MRYEFVDNYVELQIWCSEFDRNHKYPSDAMRRFAIGLYQIYQGMDWLGTDSRDESYAAAAIHFTIVGEKLSLGMEQYVPAQITEILWQKEPWKNLLYSLSKAQGMLVYSTNTDDIKRKSRYKPEKLESDLSECVKLCFGLIEPCKRQMAIETAISIMSGVL